VKLFVATAEEMQRLDRYVMQELGILPEFLMERAGSAVAETILEKFPPPKFSKVVHLCGPGNNGGDGFVCARHLWNSGYKVEVLCFGEENKYTGEAKRNLEILKTLRIPVTRIQSLEEFSSFLQHFQPEIVVDALFGTGLKRPLSGLYEEVVSLLREAKKEESFKVLSIDIPSGVSSDTGQILGSAPLADLTITFECLKPGHLFYPGKECSGEVKVVPIGYPWRYLLESQEGILPRTRFLNEEVAKELFRPRKGFYHKGKAGHVLVLAGSIGKSGAGYLSALGALRAGAGLVTLASAKSLQSVYSGLLPEILTLGLPEAEGEIAENSLEVILEALTGKRCLVVGPGLGLGSGPRRVLLELLKRVKVPIVLDADALTLLSDSLDILKSYPYPRVLTPHPGEAGRLLKREPQEILEDPLRSLSQLIELTGSIVVLKGPHTLIGDPRGLVFISSIDEPGMAQGGMGDVLTGMIGAFIAQGYSPFEASALGVYIHGASGRFLRETRGPFGFVASEVAQNIPETLKKLENKYA
jgi:NAD(P)H-hydrate epimerase